MIDKLDNLTPQIRALLLTAFGVVIVGMVLVTYAKTRALVPTLAVGITGVAGLWLANNYLLVESYVDQDLGSVVVVVDSVDLAPEAGVVVG